jgi:RNA polymerase sigma-70 factor (ECF subfamily)
VTRVEAAPAAPESGRNQAISDAFTAHRPYLLDLAYRMLGEIGAAEDTVQEAFTRLLQSDAPIQDARGWLIVVTSRLCLDQIRSTRARRDAAHAPEDLEPLTPLAAARPPDPADRVTLDESVRLALLVVMQRLSPAERVAFILHDVFALPFEQIALTVGRPVATCRQLARRARGKIQRAEADRRPAIGASEHRLVVEQFIAACSTGDLDALTAVLAPDASGEVYLGPDAARSPGVVRGARLVARNLLTFWGHGAASLVTHPAPGGPAVLAFADRRLAAVLVLTVRGELIGKVHVIADPRILALLSTQLPDPR